MAANRVSVTSGNTLSMPIGTTKYSITSQTCKKGGIKKELYLLAVSSQLIK
jgi:hypothetical protein